MTHVYPTDPTSYVCRMDNGTYYCTFTAFQDVYFAHRAKQPVTYVSVPSSIPHAYVGSFLKRSLGSWWWGANVEMRHGCPSYIGLLDPFQSLIEQGTCKLGPEA